MVAVEIAVIGTEPFYDNYSEQSASNKLSDVTNYIDNEWSTFIEDGSGSYTADVTGYSQSDVEIPSSALPDTGDLNDRLYDADDWLELNWDPYYNVTSIQIIDYYGKDDNTYGWGYIGTAGSDDNQSGLVDAQHEDTDDLPFELENVKTEGVAFHETLHTYNAQHPEGVTTDSYDYISYMYSWDGVGCTDNGDTTKVSGYTSDCTENDVRYYIDTKV
jgi:hypothetical protein